MDDFSPFSRTSSLPARPPQASPRPQLQSLHPKLCPEAGKGGGRPASPTQLLELGVHPGRCMGHPPEGVGRQGSGPAVAIPNSTGGAQRATCGLPVQSPSLAQWRAALKTGQFGVHPASSPARGG